MSKKKEEVKSELVESIGYKEIEYTCPVRGKVKQQVKVVTYKPKPNDSRDFIKSSDQLINDTAISELAELDTDDLFMDQIND